MFLGNSLMSALRSAADRPLKSSWTILMKYGWYSIAKISPGFRARAQRHDRVGQRLLAIGDLLGIIGPLQIRHLALGLVVNLQIRFDALLEFERRGALRVDSLAARGDAGGRVGLAAAAGCAWRQGRPLGVE
jgi:hypothetical protein